MIYNKLVQKLFFDAQHAGNLDCNWPRTIMTQLGIKGSSWIELYVNYDRQGIITQSCFKTYGNPYLIAALEWLCQYLEGTGINEHPLEVLPLLFKQLEIPATKYPIALQVDSCYRQTITTLKQQLKETK